MVQHHVTAKLCSREKETRTLESVHRPDLPTLVVTCSICVSIIDILWHVLDRCPGDTWSVHFPLVCFFYYVFQTIYNVSEEYPSLLWMLIYRWLFYSIQRKDIIITQTHETRLTWCINFIRFTSVYCSTFQVLNKFNWSWTSGGLLICPCSVSSFMPCRQYYFKDVKMNFFGIVRNVIVREYAQLNSQLSCKCQLRALTAMCKLTKSVWLHLYAEGISWSYVNFEAFKRNRDVNRINCCNHLVVLSSV